jgi:hypothetical protein
MTTLTLNTNETPTIRFEGVGGDLRLAGWDQNQILAQGDDIRKQGEGDVLTLFAGGNCTARIPRRATVHAAHVGGDVKVKTFDGDLTLDFVGGDVVLRQTGAARLGQLGGDLSAKKVNGTLAVKASGGDVAVRGVTGDLSVNQAGGDLYAREVTGGLNLKALGDLLASVAFAPGQTYTLHANGDLTCRLSGETSAQFAIHTNAEVNIKVAGAKVEKQPQQQVVTVGNGEAMVTLEAGGDVTLTGLVADTESYETRGDDFGPMAADFAAHIGTQVEAQLESQFADLERRINEQLAGLNLDRTRAEALAARARAAAERAQEKLRRKSEELQRKAEREAERTQRQAEAARRREGERSRHLNWALQFGPPAAPRGAQPPQPPRPPLTFKTPTAPTAPVVSEEERLAILRLLEQGKISVADAEKLLAALEGK